MGLFSRQVVQRVALLVSGGITGLGAQNLGASCADWRDLAIRLGSLTRPATQLPPDLPHNKDRKTAQRRYNAQLSNPWFSNPYGTQQVDWSGHARKRMFLMFQRNCARTAGVGLQHGVSEYGIGSREPRLAEPMKPLRSRLIV